MHLRSIRRRSFLLLHIGVNPSILLILLPKISKKARPLWPAEAAAALGCIFFVLAGMAFIPRLGVENDEALFASVFIQPVDSGAYLYHIGHLHVPLMLLSYLGTLKSWILWPIVRHFGFGLYALRMPPLLAGAASLWLFFCLLRRIAGDRAAVIGSVLLAVDACYLLTACFDWGPVALQHLLLLGGMLLLVRFWQDDDSLAGAAAFFLFGLALWDKALAIWLLSGMAIAASIVMPRETISRLTWRRVLTAGGALALGAFPLILYNVHTRGSTFRGNASFSTTDLPQKVLILSRTLDGSGLFGFMPAEDWGTPNPKKPSTPLERASAALSVAAGRPRHDLVLYAFCAALLLVPVADRRGRKAIAFALIAMTVAWVQMAFTKSAGGGVHHTILLWPLPYLIIAVAFAAASSRLHNLGLIGLIAVLIVMLTSSGLLVNEYFSNLSRNGATIFWTDAVSPLTEYLRNIRATNIYCMDWGFLDSIRMLSGGSLPARPGTDPVVKPNLTDAEKEAVGAMIREPGAVFVEHTKGLEFYPGISQRLEDLARITGYQGQIIRAVPDTNGRVTFEVLHFVRFTAHK